MTVRSFVVLISCLALVPAVEIPSPAGTLLSDLAAANRARAELASTEAAWHAERIRLQALIAAARAQSEQLARESSAVEGERDACRAELARLDSTSELTAVRTLLREAGERVAARMADLAARLAPGAITAVADPSEPFAAAAIAVDQAERAASQVTTAVVVGEVDGARTALTVLRVAGAAAWWVSLDGTTAGTVMVEAGGTRFALASEDQQRAIRAALAMVEGRKPSEPIVLPLPDTP